MRDYLAAIKSIYKWLNSCAARVVSNKLYVKERYSIGTRRWYSIRRPYYMIQAAAAYYSLWNQYGKDEYLLKARELTKNSFEGLNSSGCFIYDLDGQDSTIYVGGNCEDVIYLCAFADLDATNANEYHTVAKGVIDWILTMQNSNGGWAMNGTAYSPLGTGHALAALAYYYQYLPENEKASVLSQIERGAAFMLTKQLNTGRFLCGNEIRRGHENWRSPSSDHCIALRGLAMCEYFFPNNSNVQTWHTARMSALNYLYSLVDESGAIVNGEYDGENGTQINGADFNFLTDHVYVTRYAIDALEWCYKVDHDALEMSTLYGICQFCTGNLFEQTNDVNAKGVLRGAYNLRDENWDTSMMDMSGSAAGGEGGADMVYVGSVNAPILSQLVKYNENWANVIGEVSPIHIYSNGKVKSVLVDDATDSILKAYYNGGIHNIVLVEQGDESASDIKIDANGSVKYIAVAG